VLTHVPDSAVRQVERIALSGRHLLGLIDEILTFSRLEAGDESVDMDTVDPRTVLGEVDALMEPLARSRSLTFRCEPPQNARPFKSDLRKVRQILLNLVSNAIKFTDRGEVEVTFQQTHDTITFCVRDTGRGILPTHLESIFEPFWQVPDKHARAGGTGLGLSVSRRLARLLSGDVTVESEVGLGSTFSVVLPTRTPA